MCDVNKEARYINSKYSMQVDTLYFEWDKFIQTLEQYFPDILGEILNHDNHKYASVQGKG